MSHREQLLAEMHAGRTELETVVEGLAGRLDTECGDGWRARDLIAHLALWERAAIWRLTGAPVPHAEGLADRDPWSLDAFNEGMRERWHDRPAADVLAEFHDAHQALLAVVRGAAEEDCAPGGRVRAAIEEDGAGHYPQHVPALRGALG